MIKVTKEQLKKLQDDGAVVRRKKQPAKKPVEAKPEPPKGSTDTEKTLALAVIAAEAANKTAQAALEIAKENAKPKKLTPWKFIVRRGNGGVMTSVEARPMTE